MRQHLLRSTSVFAYALGHYQAKPIRLPVDQDHQVSHQVMDPRTECEELGFDA